MKRAILLITLMLTANVAVAQAPGEMKVNGKVREIKGDIISLDSKTGPVDVVLTETTKYQHVSGAEMKREDIEKGAFLLIVGIKSADGKVRATSVMIHPMMGHPPIGHGGTAQSNPHQMPQTHTGEGGL